MHEKKTEIFSYVTGMSTKFPLFPKGLFFVHNSYRWNPFFRAHRIWVMQESII